MRELENSEIKLLIERVTKDEKYKQLLIQDADKALQDYNFTEAQKILIKSLREEDFDKLSSENVEEYFSADSAVYTPDIDEEFEMAEAGEDDI